jgi:hypothetical protein
MRPRAAMCPVVLGLAPRSRGFRCRHRSHKSGPRLSEWKGSGTIMCHVDPDPAPCVGGLRYYHVFHGSGPRLPIREGSGAAMRPTASDPAYPLRRVLAPAWDPQLSVGTNK